MPPSSSPNHQQHRTSGIAGPLYPAPPQYGAFPGEYGTGGPIDWADSHQTTNAIDPAMYPAWIPPPPSSQQSGSSSSKRINLGNGSGVYPQGSMDERASLTTGRPEGRGQKKPRPMYSPIAGENRLKINFLNYGNPGRTPQHFGTKGYIIPNGLCGTHEVYHQRWKFEILHRQHADSVLITWNITNLASNKLISRTETAREARVRETSGHTICNQLLRNALKNRAMELEESIREFADNPTKVANTYSLVKVLKPKSCILGLLFFGLLHEAVQEKMKDMLQEMEANHHQQQQEQQEQRQPQPLQ
jgi:hypothetical protein